MELTPTNIYLAVAIIAGITWLVRLESKIGAALSKITEHDADLYTHVGDKTIHHDGDELNRRFTVVEDGIRDIKTELKTGFEKVSDRIDRLIEK